MRVITGTARGMRLKELPGLETRPTTDKVKESVFNIVQFDVEGRRVLDLFGGTGQMGIEALSRGAASCTFVDVRKEAAAVIRANLAHTKLEEQGKVVQGDYLAFLTGCREKFDLVFKAFKSIKNIKSATLAELEDAVPKNTARAVYDFFHQKGEEPSCE